MHQLLSDPRLRRNLICVLILCLASLPVVLPLFREGFFLTDDGEWMIIRFSAFYDALREGQFPVRFLGRLNHGFGYPVANFLYPGFMYLGAPIHFLGFGFVNTVKILIGGCLVGSAVLMYLWLSHFFDRWASMVGAIVYLYVPYHLYDAYRRGSVGELLSLAVMPFILWQMERKSMLFVSIGVAFLLLSHNTLAALFVPFLILYAALEIAVEKKKLHIFRQYVLMFAFGLGISSFFWIPALYDLRYTIFTSVTVSEWEKYFADLSLIGVITPVLLLIVTAIFLTRQASLAKHRLTVLFGLVCLLSLFMALPASNVIWRYFPVAFVQFPFRFLSVSIVSLGFLAAFVVAYVPKNIRLLSGIGVIALVVYSSLPFLSPQEYFDKGDMYYASNQATTTVKNEYMPPWVKEHPFSQAEAPATIEKGVVNVERRSSSEVILSLYAPQHTSVMMHTLYFPGWEVRVDGEATPVSYDNPTGVMQFPVAEGKHAVVAKFSETPLRMFANTLSVLSFLSLLIVVFYTGRSAAIVKKHE